MLLPKLYPITDRRLSGLSHAEQVARLADGGATFIQIREKHLSAREFYREAEEALRVARERGVKLIVNDRADIALALGADGVHLGQDDMPPEAARALLGDDAIIGFSTHNVAQAVEAARLPVDYVAIGPVFATSSKSKPSCSQMIRAVSGAPMSFSPSPQPCAASGSIRSMTIWRMRGSSSFTRCAVKALSISRRSRV